MVNGQLITHSHPFKKNPDKKFPYQKHNHSNSSFLLIQQLGDTNFESTQGNCEIPEIFANENLIPDPGFFFRIHNAGCTFPPLRAPPAV
jgi:hypothetical protein